MILLEFVAFIFCSSGGGCYLALAVGTGDCQSENVSQTIEDTASVTVSGPNGPIF